VFRFEQRIGTGGMGVVYRATDLSLKRDVAIKTLPRLTQGLAEQLKREAQAMAAINHPNLAVIHGIESWRETPFLIEEYLAGGTLADRLRRGPMPVAEALELGATLAAVLGHLHAAGIVHCDVKASNIGFSPYGVVKLLDFGVAHLLRDAGAVTRTSSEFGGGPLDDNDVATHGPVVGTPAYMSPEAAGGAAPAPGFDLWALGVVLFEAIAGQRPFTGRTSNEVRIRASRGERADLLALRPDCPAEVAGLFDGLLSPDPAQRPRRAADLRAQLLALQSAIL
jgi:serine/threonine protein kinase